MQALAPLTPLAPLAPVSPEWTLIDLAVGIGLGVSVLVGAWRGLLTELLALMGWAVAYFSAQFLGPDAAPHLPVGEPGTRMNVLAGMLVVFVLTWIGWAVLSWGLTQILRASGLGGTDRLMGGVFGLLRGLLVALAVVTLVSMTPLAQAELWRSSRSVEWIQLLLQGLRPILPDQVLQFLPAQPLQTGPAGSI